MKLKKTIKQLIQYYRIINPRKSQFNKLDVILSEKHKFIYIKIPKVANTSIRKALTGMDELEAREEEIDKAQLKKEYENFFVFSFIRNPYSRTVSVFNNKIHFKDPKEVKIFFERFSKLKYKMKFDAFVDFLCSFQGRDEIADQHWLSQYYFICDKKKNLLPDFIGKLENFESDWEKVCQRIGYNVPVGHYKKHNKMSKRERKYNQDYWKKYYNETLLNKIKKRYETDFAIFDDV